MELKNKLTKEELLLVPLPVETAYYKPIPHSVLFEEVYEKLYKNNLAITNETIVCNSDGQKMITKLRLNQGDDDRGFMMAFRNSYDKSMSVGFCCGLEIFICSNGSLSGEYSLKRRHQGSALLELRDLIDTTINSLEEVYKDLTQELDAMKEIELSNKMLSEYTGRLFIEEDILTSAQVTIVKNEIKKPSHVEFAEPTLYSYYNYCTEALKVSHSSKMIQDHIKLHNFFLAEWAL